MSYKTLEKNLEVGRVALLHAGEAACIGQQAQDGGFPPEEVGHIMADVDSAIAAAYRAVDAARVGDFPEAEAERDTAFEYFAKADDLLVTLLPRCLYPHRIVVRE